MSIVTKITWATTEINDRNLHKVNEEKFEAAVTSDVINKLYLEIGDRLWSYVEYNDNGDIEINYPCFDKNGKYIGAEIQWLIKETGE